MDMCVRDFHSEDSNPYSLTWYGSLDCLSHFPGESTKSHICPVISAAIAEARDKGDLSENAEYEAAREAQGLLELNIAKLQNLVANARVIDESQIGTDKVQMLNKVKVKNLNTNQIMNFTLVSEQEADFMSGKLAVKTPIGQALMGHGVGEVVEAKVPAGIIKFEILEITL